MSRVELCDAGFQLRWRSRLKRDASQLFVGHTQSLRREKPATLRQFSCRASSRFNRALRHRQIVERTSRQGQLPHPCEECLLLACLPVLLQKSDETQASSFPQPEHQGIERVAIRHITADPAVNLLSWTKSGHSSPVWRQPGMERGGVFGRGGHDTDGEGVFLQAKMPASDLRTCPENRAYQFNECEGKATQSPA